MTDVFEVGSENAAFDELRRGKVGNKDEGEKVGRCEGGKDEESGKRR